MAKSTIKTTVTVETIKTTKIELSNSDLEQILRDKFGQNCSVAFDISVGGCLLGCQLELVESKSLFKGKHK
jgi:hypothetical protein